MALVRVYCGLSSTQPAGTTPGGPGEAWLTIAVVDDSGRLLDVVDVPDDPTGYAELGAMLSERSGGSGGVSVAADSDDHQVILLLAAAGRPLAIADEESLDDYADRFGDDDSPDEMEAPVAERRAVGLARALQAGALAATVQGAPRELMALGPVLAAHAAVANGRQSAAVALREVLRELYPAALRAYPDPCEPIPLAILDALPEPGLLTGAAATRSRDAAVVAQLTAAGVADANRISEAITALRVAIAETPRRAGIGKTLTTAVAETIRQSVAAVRAFDTAVAALIGLLAEKVTPAHALGQAARGQSGLAQSGLAQSGLAQSGLGPNGLGQDALGQAARGQAALGRAATAAAATGLRQAREQGMDSSRGTRRARSAPTSGGGAHATPSVPAASLPTPPPAVNPAASAPMNAPAGPVQPPLVHRSPTAPPVVPAPAQPLMPPASLPAPPVRPAAALPPPRAPMNPPAHLPAAASAQAPAAPSAPPSHRAAPAAPPMVFSGEQPEYPYQSNSVPLPRLAPEVAAPGSRMDWPLNGNQYQPSGQPMDEVPSRRSEVRPGDPTAYPPTALPSTGLPPTVLDRSGFPGEAPVPVPVPAPRNGRVTPPWQDDDLPTEPPSLRLVEPASLADLDPFANIEPRGSHPAPADPVDLPARDGRGEVDPLGGRGPLHQDRFDNPYEPPPLRLVESDWGAVTGNQPMISQTESLGVDALTSNGRGRTSENLPVSDDSSDGDLLIFSDVKSAWFTGHLEDDDGLDWTNPADEGWQAAERVAQPVLGEETSAGLPRRVPQANLVPGSPLPPVNERDLRIVRDPAAMAAHTTGYFRGSRRGEEVRGFAVGGRPGRDSANGWEFTRDGWESDRDEGYEYRSAARR